MQWCISHTNKDEPEKPETKNTHYMIPFISSSKTAKQISGGISKIVDTFQEGGAGGRYFWAAGQVLFLELDGG